MQAMDMVRAGAIAMAVAMALLPAACARKERQTGKLAVAATIFALADLAAQVGGDMVDVTCIVPPGVTPHGFELTPRSRNGLAKAAVVIAAGPTDVWLKEDMLAPGARLVRLSDLVKPIPGEAPPTHPSVENAEAAGHHDADPHYWLNPDYMADLAIVVGEAMAAADPPHAAQYRRRASDYAGQCRALAEEMRAAAAGFKCKLFIAQHPAYGLMARAMGLKQAASIEPVVGASQTPRHLRELIDLVVELKVPAIYIEPQLPSRDAEAIRAAAAERGWKVRVLTLDPEGNPSVPGRESYLANMRTNLAALREGLNG
jgi:zinc transport system substrate-binding protein